MPPQPALDDREAGDGEQQRERDRPSDRPAHGDLRAREQRDAERDRAGFDVRPAGAAQQAPEHRRGGREQHDGEQPQPREIADDAQRTQRRFERRPVDRTAVRRGYAKQLERLFVRLAQQRVVVTKAVFVEYGLPIHRERRKKKHTEPQPEPLPGHSAFGRPPPSHAPQTSFATSTIRASFAHCSSSVNVLPSSVDAKPHCAERHS